MTEYDYSPDAYERYIAKQHAISRWVDDTNHHMPVNPFLPSQPSPPSRARGFDSGRNYDSDSDTGYERSSSSRHQHRRDRDDKYRHGRSHDGHHQESYHRHSSRKDSRSSSSPPSSYPQATNGYFSQYHSIYAHQPYPYTQQNSNQLGSSSTTPASASPPRTPYEQSQSHQPMVMPIDGGARGYVLVPPKGVSYQVVYPQQPQSPSHAQPWYKRVFSTTPSTSSGKHTNGSSQRRGSRKWSWDIY